MSGRNRMIIALTMGLLVVLAVACAPAPTPAPPAAEKPAAKEAAPPAEKPAVKVTDVKLGGVARFGTVGRPANAHPYLVPNDGPHLATVWGTVWDVLIDFDYTVEDWRIDFPMVPMLAESWRQENPTTWTFKLRQGVKWHDGKDLTVDDVIWSLEYARDQKEAFLTVRRLFGVDKIEKVDNTSWRMTLRGPYPYVLLDLAGCCNATPLVILPKHVYDEGGTALMKTKAIGTGPFKVVKFDPTSTTVMAKNENYWRKDAQGRAYPYVAGLEFVHGMDRATSEAAFAAQEVDMVWFATKKQLDAVKAAYPDFDVAYHHTADGTGFHFNVAKKPFSDIRVRKAAFLASDWHELNATLLDGFGKMSGPVVPGFKKGWGFSEEELLKMPGYRKDKTEDLKEAKRLLAEAGYPEGLKVRFIYNQGWGSAPLAEYVPVMLKKGGFDVEAQGQDGATYLKSYRDGAFDLAWLKFASEEPLKTLDRSFYSKAVEAKGAGINDPKMDKLIDDLRAAPTVDEQKRLVRALAEYQQEVLYARVLGDQAFFRATQKWLIGYRSGFGASASAILGAAAQYIWLDPDKMPAKRKR